MDIVKGLQEDGQVFLNGDDHFLAPYKEKLSYLSSEDIRQFKRSGREVLNSVLADRVDQYGRKLHFNENDFIFDFKRRFVDYKRPEMPFRDPVRLRNILESHGAHYILAGRVHAGDGIMYNKLLKLLHTIDKDDYLREHVHYIADYDEKLAHLALSRIELDLDDGVRVNYRKIQTANDGKFYEVLADSKKSMSKK